MAYFCSFMHNLHTKQHKEPHFGGSLSIDNSLNQQMYKIAAHPLKTTNNDGLNSAYQIIKTGTGRNLIIIKQFLSNHIRIKRHGTVKSFSLHLDFFLLSRSLFMKKDNEKLSIISKIQIQSKATRKRQRCDQVPRKRQHHLPTCCTCHVLIVKIMKNR